MALLNEWIEEWIADENLDLLVGVLATVDHLGKPHTRVVAIREISDKGLLFFTQQGSQKVRQLKENRAVSITLYLSKWRRQITLKGLAQPLSDAENTHYWNTRERETQLRFLAYGSRSGEKIGSNQELDQALKELKAKFHDRALERPKSYVGYRIDPEIFEFYQLNDDRLSDSFIVTHENGQWERSRVVP